MRGLQHQTGLAPISVLRNRPPNRALRASVRFEVGGYSYATIQGDPAALRELAAALVEAADQAEEEAVAAEPAVGVGS